MNSRVPQLSIIIPVYNGAAFIVATISELILSLEASCYSFEVIVVDDGSTDNTGQQLARISHDCLEVISLAKNRGKCGAIKVGMLRARGGCRIFTDADLPFGVAPLLVIARTILKRDFHVVIGDRSLVVSRYGNKAPLVRRLASWFFVTFIRLVFAGGISDSQCGVKGFRDDVAKALFSITRFPGFIGDLEVLYLALKTNLEIKRIPVRLLNVKPSTVRVFYHGGLMILQAFWLKVLWSMGKYPTETLCDISMRENREDESSCRP